MADEIKIRVATDISGLQEQMAAGASAVEQFGTKASDVLERYAAIMSGTAEQQEAVTEALKVGQAAGLSWAETVNKISAALGEMAAAEAEAAAGADVLAASEQKAAAGASGLGLSSRQAATAGIGILEGRMMSGNRAAAAFLSTTLGLGPILQAAFPVIGALALGEVLVQIATKLYDVYTKAEQAGQEIARAFDEANQKVEAGNDALALSNSRLQDEIDKLEGKPSNGLQTALLEAIALADRLQSSLAADSRSLEELLKKHEVGYFAGALTATVPTVGLDKSLIQQSEEIESKGYTILQTFKREMNDAAGDKGKLAQAQKQYFDSINGLYDGEISTLKPKLDHFYQLQKENNDKVAELHKLHLPTSIFTSEDVDYSPAVNALEKQLHQLEDLKERAKLMAASEPLEQKKGELEQHKGDESAANKAREKKLHDLEQEYSLEESLYGKSANAAAAYWDQYLNTFAQGTTQFEAVLNKVNTAREQLGKKESGSDLYGKEREELKKLAAEAKKDADEYQRALDEIAKAGQELRKEQAKQDLEDAALQHQKQLGGIQESQAKGEAAYSSQILQDPQGQLNELRAFHQQVIAEDERFLQQEIAIASAAGELDKVKELQKQLEQVRHQGNMEWIKDTAATTAKVEEEIRQAVQKMQTDFNQLFAKALTGQETWAHAAESLYRQVADTFIENILKMAEQYLVGLALQRTGQLSSIEHAAATAAANTYASVSAIPIVGPVLAPPAAAAAFAAVLAFEAFEQGGIVNGRSGMPVPIMAHAGERVLSAPQTQNFERMVNQSSSSRSNIHYAPTINGAFDHGSMKAMLSDHSDEILSIVRKGINTGALRR